MSGHCCPGEREGIFGSLVVFALLESQRRPLDSLCPRQLLPVIGFTKGLLPRTPVNQQKLYIRRKLKPFGGCRGLGTREGAAAQPGGRSPGTAGPDAAPQPGLTGAGRPPLRLAGRAAGRLRYRSGTVKAPPSRSRREHGRLEATEADLRTSSRRAGARTERRAGWNSS